MRYGSTHHGRMNWTAPAGGVIGGRAYAFGAVAGIAMSTVAAGEGFALVVTGITKALDVKATDAITVPTKVYVQANGDVTADAGGTYLGKVIDPVPANSTAKARVIVNGQ